MWLFSYLGSGSLYIIMALGVFVVLMALILYILIRSGSIYARVLLQQFATVNMLIMVTLLILVLTLSALLPG